MRSGESRSQERRTMEKGRIHLGDNITSDLGGKKRRRWSSPCGAVNHRVQGTEDQRHLCRKTHSVLTISSNMNKYSSRNILFQICKNICYSKKNLPAPCGNRVASIDRRDRLHLGRDNFCQWKERQRSIMYKISKYSMCTKYQNILWTMTCCVSVKLREIPRMRLEYE